jgi:hypothetical protein
MKQEIYTLRIYLPNGIIWTQTGLAYTSVLEVKAVWNKVGPHLPDDTEAMAIPVRQTECRENA